MAGEETVREWAGRKRITEPKIDESVTRFYRGLILQGIWLGWLDLNQRMTESESDTLQPAQGATAKKRNGFFCGAPRALTETDPIPNAPGAVRWQRTE